MSPGSGVTSSVRVMMKEEAGELIGGDKQGGDGIGRNSFLNICNSARDKLKSTWYSVEV